LLIPLLYGAAFQGAVLPFLLLLPGIIGMTISKIISANLSGTGLPQYTTFSSLSMLLVVILLDFVLIPTYDVAGAAIASTIAYLFGTLFFLYFFHRETRISWWNVVIPRRDDLFSLKGKFTDLTGKSINKLSNYIQSRQKK
jgi:Na+-driven multidrug efflux pump